MELKGLKAIFLGDSITDCVGASCRENVYWEVFGRNAGVEVKGYGVGGSRISRQDPNPHSNERSDRDFCLRATEMDKDADIVCVFGGTNDYGHGFAPIGQYGDDTVWTFYGACDVLMRYLRETYPDSFIFFMTPLHRLNEERLTGDGFRYPTLPLKGYVQIIREMAEKYSIPVLDLFRDSGINPIIPVIREKYMKDGLHPTDLGHAKIAGMIEEFLKTQYYEKKN
jgi:lysophospholipase L1-like esterase